MTRLAALRLGASALRLGASVVGCGPEASPSMRQLLFVAVHDDDYTDASDPDADLAIRIRPVGPVPLLPAGGAWGLAALWGVLGAMLLRARAARLRSRRG